MYLVRNNQTVEIVPFSLKILLSEAMADGTALMGDDVIGYKFIGDRSNLWNNLLIQYQQESHQRERLNRYWLNQQGFLCMDYEKETWMQH